MTAQPGADKPDDPGPRIPRQPRTAAPVPDPSTKVVAAPAAKPAPTTPVRDPGKPADNGPTDNGPTDKEPASGEASIQVIPVKEPADWRNFAPPPDREPHPVARAASRVSRPLRFVGHEWTLAILCGLALAVVLNHGALTDPAHTLPQDTYDPSLLAYLIAWNGFALSHFPGDLWQINAFFPSAYGLAYSDALIGYAPFGLVGTGPEAAVLRYNIVYILAQALTFIGGYALVRQLGAARVAAAMAAVALGLAPWRLGQAGHLQVLSTGGILLALAMLARGHGVRWRRSPRPEDQQPPKRPGWAIAGWVCATWQLTIGFGIGLVFAYVLLGICLVGLVWWALRSRRLPSRWLLGADLGGGILFAGTALLLAQPYLLVLKQYPNVARTDAWIALYSPPVRGFFTAPDTSLVWGDAHAPSRLLLSLPGEMALLPGFALYALAAAGVLFSVWRIQVRLALLAGVLITAMLALGTNGPDGGQWGYLWLLHHLPGLEGLRTPGRLIIWTTVLLVLLAAGGVSALAARAMEVAQRRGLPRPNGVARLALLLPLALVLVEGLGTTPHAAVPPAPAVLATAKAPLLVLPSNELQDMHVMLWSTDRFPDLVNGGSGLVPAEIAETRKQVERFPDAASISYLRGQGVNTVVVLVDRARGTTWESSGTVPIDSLGITREVTTEAVIFHLT